MIDISHIHCTFGRQTILDDLTFRIPQGSFHAIMGANGSGKTTLLRCMAGLLRPSSGTIRIAGRNIAEYPIRELAKTMAFVQQHPHNDIEFSALDTVMMGRNPYQRHLQNESQADMDIVKKCMMQTNVWHLRDAYPGQMSGGELQRVMIARALAQQTPILLLDEPTSSLDISHQFEIMELLCRIRNDEGKTILIVVHDLNLALHYCPDTLLLHDHKLFFQGTTEQALSTGNIKTVFNVQSQKHDGNLILSSTQNPQF